MSRKNDDTFDISQWCDYVRGLLDETAEESMRRHLATSAEDRRTVRALRQVEALAKADRQLVPPAWAVRSAKAIAGLGRSTDSERPSLLHRIAMSLTFDSLASPALAGTRDAQTNDRFLVFDGESYRLDLRVEPEADLQTSVVVGQLLGTEGEIRPIVEVPILAVQDGHVVAQTRTGRFGEFQADRLPMSNLRLHLLPDEDTCLEVEIGHNDLDGNHPGDVA